MQITRQADYALRAISYLSKQGNNGKTATNLIAVEQKIPPSFLAKIISQLSLAGLIHTSRGAGGGVSLAKPPGEISVLDVVEAIDGPVTLNDCTKDSTDCPFLETCPVQEVWCKAQSDLVGKLSSATFSNPQASMV
jgi:Rrf2 family protein